MTRHGKAKSPNKEKVESTKFTIRNKKLFVIDTLIIAGIVSSAVLGFVIFITKPQINYYDSMTDISPSNEIWFHTSFNFTGETLSAETPLTVSVYSYPDPSYYAKHPNEVSVLGQKAYLYLPTSAPMNPTFDHGNLLAEPIVLTRGSNDYFYRNSSAIVFYHSEGAKCAIFSLIQIHELPPCLPNASPIIQISSADTLYQLESNRTTTALTFLIFAFSIAVIRDFIKDFAQNFIRVKSITKDETTNATPDEKTNTTKPSDKDMA